MNTRWIIFFVMFMISLMLEKHVTNCKNTDNVVKRQSVSIFHHLLVTWVYFGPFIFHSYFLIHLLVVLGIFIQWDIVEMITGSNACTLTRVYNHLCGNGIDEPFKDINYFLGAYPYLALLPIFYDLYFISKGKYI